MDIDKECSTQNNFSEQSHNTQRIRSVDGYKEMVWMYYMDDFLNSEDNVEKANAVSKQSKQLLLKARFIFNEKASSKSDKLKHRRSFANSPAVLNLE